MISCAGVGSGLEEEVVVVLLLRIELRVPCRATLVGRFDFLVELFTWEDGDLRFFEMLL